MKFDATVRHDGTCVRVRVAGDAPVGRVLSLLQVLEVDCRSWAEPAVLVDLRELQPPLRSDEQEQVAAAIAHAFSRLRKVALLGVAAGPREAEGVRAFDDEASARAWAERP